MIPCSEVSRTVIHGDENVGCREGGGELFSGFRISSVQDESKVLDVEIGRGCTTVRMPLNCVLKTGMLNLVLCVLLQLALNFAVA